MLKNLQTSVRGFSVPELMISSLLLGGVMAAGMKIAANLKKTQMASEVTTELQIKAAQASKVIGDELDRAIRISGDTNAGTHFENTVLYGISRFPNSAATEVSDGIQFFVYDTEASLEQVYSVTGITVSAGNSTIVVEGDFRPLISIGPGGSEGDDLFIVKNNDRTELFKVTASVSYDSGANTSSFQTAQDPSEFLDNVNSPGTNGTAELYRVQKKLLFVAAGGGLYLQARGKNRLISIDAHSFQAYYSWNAQEETAEADCASKNQLRYIDQPADATECDWNDLQSIRMELVMASKADVLDGEAEYPHEAGVSDKKAKVLYTFSKVPAVYSAESIN